MKLLVSSPANFRWQLGGSYLSNASMHRHGWCVHVLNCVGCPNPDGLGKWLEVNDRREFSHLRTEWPSVWTLAAVTLAHVRKHVDVMLWPTTVSKTK